MMISFQLPLKHACFSFVTDSSLPSSTCDSDQTLTRRSSSGGLMSPEVDGGPRGPVGAPTEQDGFYLLKKDSQRRMTLSRVLSQDQGNICQVWLKSINKDIGETVLHMNHLEILMRGLRDFIADQNKDVLENAIHNLKEELDFDSVAINQLHFALYSFQDAVNTVLRHHSIKPHWMFALDNLVRTAVQAAITVLSPELGANLAGQDGHDGVKGGAPDVGISPSVLSMANSIKSQKTSVDSFASSIRFRNEYRDQLHSLKAENNRLLQELVEGQHMYQILLRQALEENKSHLQLLKQAVEQMSFVSSLVRGERESSVVDSGGGSRNSPEANGRVPPHISVTDSSADTKLIDWLQNIGLDQQSIDKFLMEEYCLEDILHYVNRDDIRRLGLRGGVELRVWKAITKWRREHRPICDTARRKSVSAAIELETTNMNFKLKESSSGVNNK